MTQYATDKLYDYWRTKSDGHSVPERKDLIMSEMTKFIPEFMILERSNQGASFRLAGSDVCSTHRSELRATPLRSLFAYQDRRSLDVLIEKIFDRQAAFRISTRVKSEMGYAEFDTVLLPLGNGEEGVSRIAGAQSTTSVPASTWWLGSYNVGLHSVIGIEELAWRGATTVVRDPRLQPPAYEVPVLEFSRRGRPPEGRKVGHLTVIDGGAHA